MGKLNVSNMLGDLHKHFNSEEAAVETQASDDRLALEKPPLSPHDGRVARGKGKNVPLNFRVTLAFKQRFLAAAQARNITMTDLLETAFEALEATEKGKKK